MTRIAFGSCARFSRRKTQPAWEAISKSDPDLLILLGDNIYARTKKWSSRKRLQKKYDAQMAVPGFKNLLNSMPFLATWDDHDLGPNNAMGGSEIGQVHRHAARDAFLANLRSDNKSLGQLEIGKNDIFCKLIVRDILIIVLDCRFFRTAPQMGTGHELLGAQQELWLWSALASAKSGKFKSVIVCSGSTCDSSSQFGETLHQYPHFYERFRSELSNCPTPIVLSGDIHRNRVIDHSGEFKEFVSSGIAQIKNGRDLDNWGYLQFKDDGYELTMHEAEVSSKHCFQYS